MKFKTVEICNFVCFYSHEMKLHDVFFSYHSLANFVWGEWGGRYVNMWLYQVQKINKVSTQGSLEKQEDKMNLD